MALLDLAPDLIGVLDARLEGLVDAAVDELGARAGLLPRERAVARLLAHGRRGGEICAELRIARETYKTHSRRVYAKTGTDDAEHWRALVHLTVARWLLAHAAPPAGGLR